MPPLLPYLPALMTASLLVFLAVLFRPYLGGSGRPATSSARPPRGADRPIILVPICDEPLGIVRDQIASLSGVLRTSPACRAYLVDNSRDGRNSPAYRSLASGGPVEYLRFPNRGSKAAALNDALRSVGRDATHVAVFDADQKPVADFFSRFLPVLESNESAAFVQAPQSFASSWPTLLVSALRLLTILHYSIYLNGRNRAHTCPSLGTNVIYRADRLKQAGGFPEGVQTEDSVLSLRLHALGYSSLYVDRTAAYGLLPKTLEAFFVQRSRWVRGAAELLLLSRRYLTDRSNWRVLFHYYLPIALYLSGLHFLLLALLPAIAVTFPLSSGQSAAAACLLFLPFAIGLVMLRRRFKLRELLPAYGLMAVAAPVTVVGLLRGLFRPGAFETTPRGWAGPGRWTVTTLVTLFGTLAIDGLALYWRGLDGLPAGTVWLAIGLLLHQAGICVMAVLFARAQPAGVSAAATPAAAGG